MSIMAKKRTVMVLTGRSWYQVIEEKIPKSIIDTYYINDFYSVNTFKSPEQYYRKIFGKLFFKVRIQQFLIFGCLNMLML